jgi:hypothetical protein
MARLLLTLTFALAMLAGCGGDDGGGDGGGGGGDAMTQEEFVSEANKICREGSAKLESKTKEVQEKVQGADSPEEQQKVVADVLEDVAAEYDPYLDKLHNLNPPENISADWDKFLGGIDKAFDLIGDLADATRDGDQEKLQGLTDDFTQIASDTRPFAQKYKLDDCLPDDSPSSTTG